MPKPEFDGSMIIGGTQADLHARDRRWEQDRARRTLRRTVFVTSSGKSFYLAGEAEALPREDEHSPREYKVRSFRPPRP